MHNIKDKSVYKHVFNQFYKGLVIYAQNFLYDLQASEDIVQEVFIQLWENSDDLEIHTSIKSYLYTSVRNKCYNYLRDIKIEYDLNIFELNASLSTENEIDIVDSQEKQIIYRQVIEVVEEFPSNMKKVFQLKYLENYTYAEIATELGISINSVKTQLKRAKVKINEALVLIVFLSSYF